MIGMLATQWRQGDEPLEVFYHTPDVAGGHHEW